MQRSWYSVTNQYKAVGLPGSDTVVSLGSNTDLYMPRTSVLMIQSVPQGHQPPKLVQDAQSGTLQSCQHGLDPLHSLEHCFLLTVGIFVMWSIGFTVLMLGSQCNVAGHKKLTAEGQKGLWNSTKPKHPCYYHESHDTANSSADPLLGLDLCPGSCRISRIQFRLQNPNPSQIRNC